MAPLLEERGHPAGRGRSGGEGAPGVGAGFVARLTGDGAPDPGFGNDGLFGGHALGENPLGGETITEPTVGQSGVITYRSTDVYPCEPRQSRYGIAQSAGFESVRPSSFNGATSVSTTARRRCGSAGPMSKAGSSRRSRSMGAGPSSYRRRLPGRSGPGWTPSRASRPTGSSDLTTADIWMSTLCGGG